MQGIVDVRLAVRHFIEAATMGMVVVVEAALITRRSRGPILSLASFSPVTCRLHISETHLITHGEDRHLKATPLNITATGHRASHHLGMDRIKGTTIDRSDPCLLDMGTIGHHLGTGIITNTR